MRLNIEIFLPGYCFDEIAMISIAKQSFPLEILKQAALLDYHAPLYYFVAHFFTKLHHEWLYLRFFNLFLSLVNVYVFYRIGKEINNKTLGILTALFFAVNHLAISTVSFVKFYCLCFLLSSISTLFFIKSIKKEKYLKILGIINAFYCFSATLGFIFVVLQYITLYFINKSTIKNILKSFLISMLGFLIYLPALIYQSNVAFHNLLSPHCAYSGAYFTEIFGIFNDFITPFLNYCCNYNTLEANDIIYAAISSFLNKKIDFLMLFASLICSIIPVLIAIFLNYKAITNNKYSKYISIVGYSFLLSLILLIKFQVLGLVTIYFYPFGLIFIVLSACGLQYLKSKKISAVILIYLIGIQILISNVFPIKERESDKDKIYYCIEKYFKDNKEKKDTVYLMTVGGRFLKKYYKDKNIISFDYEQMGGSHDKKYLNLLFGENVTKKLTKFNAPEILKPIIENNERNPEFEKYVKENVINKLSKGQTLVLSFNCDGSPYTDTDENIKKILNSKDYTPTLLDPLKELGTDTEYKHTNASDIFYVIDSFSNKYLFEILDKNLKRVKIEQYILTPEFDYKKNFSTDFMPQDTIWISEHADKGWVFITYVKD